MSYTITNPNGTTLVVLQDGKVDQSTTSLSLIGKNTSNYGEYFNNNLVRLLTNFANSTGNPPRSPQPGQLWYDTSVRRLKVYDNGFKSVSGVPYSTTRPSTAVDGDLWYDTTNYQLNILISGHVYNIGPAYPSTTGVPEQGWLIPDPPITSVETGLPQEILALKSYGTVLALANGGSKFTMTASSATTYLPNITTSTDRTVVAGITIPGDLLVYGRMSNDYLSVSMDLNQVKFSITGSSGPAADSWDITSIVEQNNQICILLNNIFPVNPITQNSYQYSGLIDGTMARVLCSYSYRAGGAGSQYGYQSRMFHVVGSGWQSYNVSTISPNPSILTNIMSDTLVP